MQKFPQELYESITKTHNHRQRDNFKKIFSLIVDYLTISDIGIKTSDVFRYITDNLKIHMSEKEFKLKYKYSFSSLIKKVPLVLLNKLSNPEVLFPVPPKGIVLPRTYSECVAMFDKKTNKFIIKKDYESTKSSSTSFYDSDAYRISLSNNETTFSDNETDDSSPSFYDSDAYRISLSNNDTIDEL